MHSAGPADKTRQGCNLKRSISRHRSTETAAEFLNSVLRKEQNNSPQGSVLAPARQKCHAFAY